MFSVCVCVCVFLCLCTGRGLATIWSPAHEVLPSVQDLETEVKRRVSWRQAKAQIGAVAPRKKIRRKRSVWYSLNVRSLALTVNWVPGWTFFYLTYVDQLPNRAVTPKKKHYYIPRQLPTVQTSVS
jgi:hypothetical protein